MNEQIEQVIKAAISDVDLTLEEIPAIDLYLDQILSLVSDKNAKCSDRYKDRVLTKTMINNYSKEGAILPIKGKKYNRRQVLQILFIYSLKSTLSIGEIKRIFEGTFEMEGFKEEDFDALWRDYLATKETSREKTEEICEKIAKAEEFDLSRDEDYLRFLLAIVSLSAYLKVVAKGLIDARFPEREAAEAEKTPKSEKAQKSEKEAKPEKIKADKAEKAERKKAKKKEKAAEKTDEEAQSAKSESGFDATSDSSV